MLIDVSKLHNPSDPTTKTPGGIMMFKPYHQGANNGWNMPIFGWSTMTTKNLMHAANIGHLNEDVTVGEHQGIPMTVHTFVGQDWKPAVQTMGQKASPLDMHKLAIMDYLTDNGDRHGHNLFLGPPDERGEHNKILGIDHERSFTYRTTGKNKHSLVHPSHFFNASGYKNLLRSYQDKDSEYEAPQFSKIFGNKYGRDLKDWWLEHGHKTKEALEHDLLSLKDDKLRAHIRENFDKRYKVVDDWARGKSEINWENGALFDDRLPAHENIPLSSRYETPRAILEHFANKPPEQAAAAVARAINANPQYIRPLSFALEALGKRMSTNDLADFFINNHDNPSIDTTHIAITQHDLKKQIEIVDLIKQKLAKFPNLQQNNFPFLDVIAERAKHYINKPEESTVKLAAGGK
jgi:hypothetical protein